jgi:tetratricopeptide (TPR) repeat protein
LNRGIIKAQKHLHQEAIADFDKAIEINATFVDAIQNRAISKAMLNQSDALNDFDLVIKLSPENGEAYYNRALHIKNFKLKQDYCFDLKKATELGYTPALKLVKQYCKI